MSTNRSMLLPPKMTKTFADRARNGDFEYHIGAGIYIWFQGNQKITLIGLDASTGTITKLTSAEVEQDKKSFAASMRPVAQKKGETQQGG